MFKHSSALSHSCNTWLWVWLANMRCAVHRAKVMALYVTSQILEVKGSSEGILYDEIYSMIIEK